MIHLRLKQARISRGFKSAIEFARYAGIEEGTYRHHESGVRGLTVPAIRKYTDLLNICPCWLLTGEGGMHVKKRKDAVKFIEPKSAKDKKTSIVNQFSTLSLKDQKEVLKVLARSAHQ